MKIIINGCEGKMGQILTKLSMQNHEVVCGISTRNAKDSFPIFDDINNFSGYADVLIDFSTALAVPKIIDYCVKRKIPAVICTTGIDAETEKKFVMPQKLFQSSSLQICRSE